MELCLITCASDQHVAFQLTQRYVTRCCEALPLDVSVSWCIIDDGKTKITPIPINGIRTYHVLRPPIANGLRSFRANIMTAISHARTRLSDEALVAVIEDDWYSAHYLVDAVTAFSQNPSLRLFGETGTRYYRIDNRRWYVYRANGRAALSATVMRCAQLTNIEDWTRTGDDVILEDMLWKDPAVRDHQRQLLPESRYVVGIKGLPGKRGLGQGAHLNDRHHLDGDGQQLRQWVGEEDAGVYEEIISRYFVPGTVPCASADEY